MSNTKKTGAAKVEVSEQKERVVITTTSGHVFEIIVNEDKIDVFASTGFGSGLVIKPKSNNNISLTQDQI